MLHSNWKNDFFRKAHPENRSPFCGSKWGFLLLSASDFDTVPYANSQLAIQEIFLGPLLTNAGASF